MMAKQPHVFSRIGRIETVDPHHLPVKPVDGGVTERVAGAGAVRCTRQAAVLKLMKKLRQLLLKFRLTIMRCHGGSLLCGSKLVARRPNPACAV